MSRLPARTFIRSFSSSMSSAAGRPKVLLMDDIQLAKPVLKDLEKKYSFVSLQSKNRDEFLEDCGSKYGDIVALYRHFKGPATKVTGLFDPELVAGLPKSLKFIAHNGAGYDQINVQACTERGIQVSNVPTAVDGATADTALFLLLGAIRQFGIAQSNLYAGKFNAGLGLSNDPIGKMVGIVGMGGIGRAFAERCAALGMNIQYYNRNRLSEAKEQITPALKASYVSFEELIKTSDVISLNLPLNSQTKHLIGRDVFKQMKKSAVLINTARGGVVDEVALVEALDHGIIAGCGLDVYENEPTVSDGLLKSPKAFLLPHVGTVTHETQTEMEAVCLRNIDTGIKTGKLGFTVPEQKGIF